MSSGKTNWQVVKFGLQPSEQYKPGNRYEIGPSFRHTLEVDIAENCPSWPAQIKNVWSLTVHGSLASSAGFRPITLFAETQVCLPENHPD